MSWPPIASAGGQTATSPWPASTWPLCASWRKHSQPSALPSPPPLVEPRAPITDEVAPIPAPAADAALATSWSGRLFALSLLVATIGGLGWLGREVYFVATDSWIAPLHLSPDSDGVAALRMQRQRQLAELARLDAEVTRIDGELTAINAAVVRLDKLNGATAPVRARLGARVGQRSFAMVVDLSPGVGTEEKTFEFSL